MRTVVVMAFIISVAFLVLLSGLVLPITISLPILVLAILSDNLTTYRCLKMGGTEANPIIRFFFKRLGVNLSLVLWWIVWMLIIYYRFIPAVPQVQTAAALMYWVVPINNLVVIAKLNRKLRCVNAGITE